MRRRREEVERFLQEEEARKRKEDAKHKAAAQAIVERFGREGVLFLLSTLGGGFSPSSWGVIRQLEVEFGDSGAGL